MKSFVPAVNYEEDAAVLPRTLARRGCRLEPVPSRTGGALTQTRAELNSGQRLFTQFARVAAGGTVTWVLDEVPAGFEPWDPLLAREISAELGGFAVGMEASRNIGRFGY